MAPAGLLVAGVRVVAIHLACGCCLDETRLAVTDACQRYEDHVLRPAVRWMDGHLAPRVCGVEVVINGGRRQLLTEHDL